MRDENLVRPLQNIDRQRSGQQCPLLMLLAAFTMTALASPTGAQEPDSETTRGTTPGGVEYGLWGHKAKTPAPTLFVLSGDLAVTLGQTYYRQCGNQLADQGYLCASIDLPDHGKHVTKGQPSGISGWSHRAGKGENIVAENNARLSEVLDHLIVTGVTDPERVAVCGTSRGGFLAIHFAAHDNRVKCAAAFAPVTDLAMLREFNGKEDLSLVKEMSIASQADKLAGRPVWIIIGDRDDRVGTDSVISTTRALSAAAQNKDVPSNVELHVKSEPRGHTTPKGASDLAAVWVDGYLSDPDTAHSN